MREYWDEGARRNAAWYVDTSIGYDEPDMARFFDTGKQIVEELVDQAPLRPARRQLAIEIGSGLGRVCTALADRFERVVGIDVSPEMVQRARALVTDPRVTFLVGDGRTLAGVENGSADLVVSFTVFQHIPRVAVVRGYIEEAGRVLRPGGVLAFQWNNTPGHRRWAARRALLAVLQRSGLHAERYRRNAPEFLGSRIPITPIRRSLEDNRLELRHTASLGTLWARAWAERTG